MPKANGPYDFTPKQGEGVGRIYRVESSGPHRAEGHLISLDSLHWSPIQGGGLAYGQRIGRTDRYGLGRRKRWPN